MSSRRRSRQRALQILFLWDARRQPVDDAIAAYYDTLSDEHPERDEFVTSLVHGAVENVADVDARITRHAEHWRMERMPAVDRNILRLAVYESDRILLFFRRTQSFNPGGRRGSEFIARSPVRSCVGKHK